MTEPIYAEWLRKLFDIIVEGHCRPCEASEKAAHEINYGNPLACGCRCEAIQETLFHARAISDAIDAQVRRAGLQGWDVGSAGSMNDVS